MRLIIDKPLMEMTPLETKLELLATFIQREQMDTAKQMAVEIIREYDR